MMMNREVNEMNKIDEMNENRGTILDKVKEIFADRGVIDALLASAVLVMICYLLGGMFPKYMLQLERSGMFVAVIRYAILFGIAGVFLSMNLPQPPVAGQLMPAFVYARPYRMKTFYSGLAVC